MNFPSRYPLFLGDLSLFCSEQDVYEAFAVFGEIAEVRIKRSRQTGKALSYGFVEFMSQNAAESAVKVMNGKIFLGRSLRVRWAVDRTQQFPAGSGVECNYNHLPKKVKTADLPSSRAPAAHIRFSSLKPGIVITEMSLRKLFSQYGDVLDCTIKQSKTSSKDNRCYGYGFAVFHDNLSGVAAVVKAAAELNGAVLDGVRINVTLSHRLARAVKSEKSSTTLTCGLRSVSAEPFPCLYHFSAAGSPSSVEMTGVPNSDGAFPSSKHFAQQQQSNRSGCESPYEESSLGESARDEGDSEGGGACHDVRISICSRLLSSAAATTADPDPAAPTATAEVAHSMSPTSASYCYSAAATTADVAHSMSPTSASYCYSESTSPYPREAPNPRGDSVACSAHRNGVRAPTTACSTTTIAATSAADHGAGAASRERLHVSAKVELHTTRGSTDCPNPTQTSIPPSPPWPKSETNHHQQQRPQRKGAGKHLSQYSLYTERCHHTGQQYQPTQYEAEYNMHGPAFNMGHHSARQHPHQRRHCHGQQQNQHQRHWPKSQLQQRKQPQQQPQQSESVGEIVDPNIHNPHSGSANSKHTFLRTNSVALQAAASFSIMPDCSSSRRPVAATNQVGYNPYVEAVGNYWGFNPQHFPTPGFNAMSVPVPAPVALQMGPTYYPIPKWQQNAHLQTFGIGSDLLPPMEQQQQLQNYMLIQQQQYYMQVVFQQQVLQQVQQNMSHQQNTLNPQFMVQGRRVYAATSAVSSISIPYDAHAGHATTGAVQQRDVSNSSPDSASNV